MAVPAAGPRAWLGRDLAAYYAAPPHGETAELQPLSARELLLDDAAHLRAGHARLREQGVTPQAAATYLAGWFAGGAARVVGLALATAGAGFLLAPGAVRWHLDSAGWPERVSLEDPMVVVPAGHEWASEPGTEAVAYLDEVIARAVAGVMAFAAPIVEACRGLARVSRVGLWDEVADGLACALSNRPDLRVTADMLAILDAAVRTRGTPWRARPRLGFTDSPILGTVHVVQKGGCCLAFTNPDRGGVDEAALDAEQRAYRRRFPPSTPQYCSTCRFRSPQDCDDRQRYWQELAHAKRSGVVAG